MNWNEKRRSETSGIDGESWYSPINKKTDRLTTSPLVSRPVLALAALL